jgi:hypothetical protein
MAEFDRIVGFSYLKGMHLNGNFVASAVPSLPHTQKKKILCAKGILPFGASSHACRLQVGAGEQLGQAREYWEGEDRIGMLPLSRI